MASNSALNFQQSTLSDALSGFWKLAADRAVTLSPDEAGVLRVAQGQVWVTLDGPHQGPANDWGDMVLHPGEQLRLMPGQQAVVESFGDAVNESAYFSWEPVGARTQAVPTQESGWSDVLARPSLHGPAVEHRARVVTFRSLVRLLSTACGYLRYLVAGQGKVMSFYEANQP